MAKVADGQLGLSEFREPQRMRYAKMILGLVAIVLRASLNVSQDLLAVRVYVRGHFAGKYR